MIGNLHTVAGTDGHGGGDNAIVQQRAIGGTEILDDPTSPAANHPSVQLGNPSIVDDNLTTRRASDDGLTLDLEDRAGRRRRGNNDDARPDPFICLLYTSDAADE